MIEKYQQAHKDSVRSIYFDMDMIKRLTNVKGAAGISIFFAKNDNNQNTVVLLPVDENGVIIHKNAKSTSMSATSSTSDEGDDTGVEVGNPCPPYCTQNL